MELKHPAIRSSLFRIVGTYEVDLVLGNKDYEDEFTLRIELFQSTSEKSLYRYKAWRSEFFRIQSTFPQNESGNPQHQASDEILLVAYSQPRFTYNGEFNASSHEEALNKIVENLSKSLEHITLIQPTWRA